MWASGQQEVQDAEARLEEGRQRAADCARVIAESQAELLRLRAVAHGCALGAHVSSGGAVRDALQLTTGDEDAVSAEDVAWCEAAHTQAVAQQDTTARRHAQEAQAARRHVVSALRAYREAEQSRGYLCEYQRGFIELGALARDIFGGGREQLTWLPPRYALVHLAAMRTDLMIWRRVRDGLPTAAAVDFERGGVGPDPAPQSAEPLRTRGCASPEPSLLAQLPDEAWLRMLGSGWLLHGLGRLAPCAQLFGGRRGQPLFEQPAGLSMCEAAARSLCARLDPADARAGRTWLCVSAGRQLLRLAIQVDHENTAHCEEVGVVAGRGVEALREARARGVSVNARLVSTRWTAIMAASLKGEADAVKNVIAVGAALDLQNNQGDTALVLAAAAGHVGVVQLLIAAGADRDQPGRDGKTALHAAVERDKAEVVELLLQGAESGPGGLQFDPVNDDAMDAETPVLPCSPADALHPGAVEEATLPARFSSSGRAGETLRVLDGLCFRDDSGELLPPPLCTPFHRVLQKHTHTHTRARAHTHAHTHTHAHARPLHTAHRGQPPGPPAHRLPSLLTHLPHWARAQGAPCGYSTWTIARRWCRASVTCLRPPTDGPSPQPTGYMCTFRVYGSGASRCPMKRARCGSARVEKKARGTSS